jgi:hypothetical protein
MDRICLSIHQKGIGALAGLVLRSPAHEINQCGKLTGGRRNRKIEQTAAHTT